MFCLNYISSSILISFCECNESLLSSTCIRNIFIVDGALLLLGTILGTIAVIFCLATPLVSLILLLFFAIMIIDTLAIGYTCCFKAPSEPIDYSKEAMNDILSDQEDQNRLVYWFDQSPFENL
ncbi:MAG: hypothetical protein WDZ28_05860 [Simkaniaceae bacterium]